MTFFRRQGYFVGAPPRVQNIRGGGARDRQCIRFQTYSHPDFKFYDELFYPMHENKGLRRKKRIPKDIDKFLTPRALAYWFMDDGTYHTNKSVTRNYVFATHSFPLEDQETLVQALRDNFEIAATIQKHRSYYMLYILKKSTNPFVDLIRPYLHTCFDYKIL